MIASFFANIISISFVAGIVAIAVMLLRVMFKKVPRWITCALWALVGLRLLFPFAPESRFSLIPDTDVLKVNTSSQSAEALKAYTGYHPLNTTASPQISAAPAADQSLQIMDILAIVWIAVGVCILLYGVISYPLMYLRVRTAIPLKKNIYQSERVHSPFVLGFLNPKIYIPFNLSGRTLKYVLAHEEAHIKRKDHIIKPLAFVILAVHWFNPVLWISYVLLCRDIEVACDEKVIRNYSINKRKNYAFALLKCKVKRSNIALCPVAFGEVNVSTRIKKTLSYKKPAVAVITLAAVLSIVAACCLLTNPKREPLSVKPAEENIPAQAVTEPADTKAATEPAAVETTAVNTQIVTEPATESVTQIVTEAQDEYYYEEYSEEDYFEDEYYYEEYIEESVDAAVERPQWDLVLPTFNNSDSSYSLIDNTFRDVQYHSSTCTCSSCFASGKPIVWDPQYYMQQNSFENSPFNNNNNSFRIY